MSHHPSKKIIAFVGLPGAGKSSAVDYLTAKGLPKIYVGGLIVEGVKALGLPVNPQNERDYRERMRREHGKDYFIRECAKQIKHLFDAGQHTVVLDGLYTWTEYKFLKHEFPGELITIAIVVPRRERHHRLAVRPVRPLTKAEATERDWAEIENLEKGGPIAIADYFLHNDISLDALHADIDALLRFLGLE